MNKILRSIILLLILTSFTPQPAGGDFCGLKNMAFQAGESVTMRVFYNAAGVYISAGDATFNTTLEKFNGKMAYHCVGEGKTFPFFDKFFKVRDRYESYIDTTSLLPINFIALNLPYLVFTFSLPR